MTMDRQRPLAHTLVAAVVVLAVASAACDVGANGSAADADPLATVAQGSGAEALISGTLEITPSCVLLDEQDELVLLVWPADRTVWDPTNDSVVLTSHSGDVSGLTNGTEVVFSGGGSSTAEGGEPADAFIASVQWEQAPALECVHDTRWFIGDLVPSSG